MQEIWKSIPQYEGLYEASSFGRIRTAKGKTTSNARYSQRIWKQRILKQKTECRGNSRKGKKDARVELWKDGTHKTLLVSRLVALSFIPNPENKPQINHIDGNPENNKVSNLEWSTSKENNNHAFKNRLMSTNQDIVLLNKDTFEVIYFYSKAEASRFLGKNDGYISGKLKQGKTTFGKFEVYLKAG